MYVQEREGCHAEILRVCTCFPEFCKANAAGNERDALLVYGDINTNVSGSAAEADLTFSRHSAALMAPQMGASHLEENASVIRVQMVSYSELGRPLVW
jgi:hypothetical protein